MKKKYVGLKYIVALGFWCQIEASHQKTLSLKEIIPPKYTQKSSLSYTLDSPKKGGDLSYAVGKIDFNTFNPFLLMAWPAEGSDNLHATLMFQPLDDQTNLYPYLGESYDYTEKEVHFKLRQDATFSDGTQIQAEDVVYSFELLKEKGHQRFQQAFQGITAKKGPTPRDILFQGDILRKEQIFQVALLPVFKKGYLSTTRLEKPIVSGPYGVESFRPNQYVSYQKRQNWWGEALWFNKNRFNFNRIKILYLPNSEVSFQAFKKKKYRLRRELNVQWWHHRYESLISAHPEIKVFTIKPNYSQKIAGIFINTQNPFLADQEIREGIRALFDFDFLNTTCYFSSFNYVQSMFLDEELTHFFKENADRIQKVLQAEKFKQSSQTISESSLILPQSVEQQTKEKDSLSLHSFATATKERGAKKMTRATLKKLFIDRGWEYVGGQLVHSKTKEPAQIIIVGLIPFHKHVLQGWVQDLRALGVGVVLKMASPGEYFKRIHSGLFDLILLNGSSYQDIVEGITSFWKPYTTEKKHSNLSHVNDPILMRLITKLQKEKDPFTQKVLMGAISQQAYDQAYYMPIWSRKFFYMVSWDRYCWPESTMGQADYMNWAVSSETKDV